MVWSRIRSPKNDSAYFRKHRASGLPYGKALSLRFTRSTSLIPGAIVVSFPKLKYYETNGVLSIPKEQGWIIDGQHRLAGAHEARDTVDIDLPIVAFSGLSDGRQVELFITINKEVKNVPSNDIRTFTL